MECEPLGLPEEYFFRRIKGKAEALHSMVLSQNYNFFSETIEN